MGRGGDRLDLQLTNPTCEEKPLRALEKLTHIISYCCSAQSGCRQPPFVLSTQVQSNYARVMGAFTLTDLDPHGGGIPSDMALSNVPRRDSGLFTCRLPVRCYTADLRAFQRALLGTADTTAIYTNSSSTLPRGYATVEQFRQAAYTGDEQPWEQTAAKAAFTWQPSDVHVDSDRPSITAGQGRAHVTSGATESAYGNMPLAQSVAALGGLTSMVMCCMAVCRRCRRAGRGMRATSGRCVPPMPVSRRS